MDGGNIIRYCVPNRLQWWGALEQKLGGEDQAWLLKSEQHSWNPELLAAGLMLGAGSITDAFEVKEAGMLGVE